MLAGMLDAERGYVSALLPLQGVAEAEEYGELDMWFWQQHINSSRSSLVSVAC